MKKCLSESSIDCQANYLAVEGTVSNISPETKVQQCNSMPKCDHCKTTVTPFHVQDA